MNPKPEIGSITWCDLTVPDATVIKNFYEKVIGWKADPVSMGDYDDFSMIAPESSKIAAGICNAKGINAKLPPQWLIYITVENVDTSAQTCLELGGRVLIEPKTISNYGRFCVIQDPAGAVCALFKPE
ncbi:Lactoylglutathione lyase-like protein [Ignavibacterium album JCM 16511]|uniref:Lactoylglutathione lyase-like protein n=1 Tax=Ignavibacterium album (strain DSM 19864 / JCM 16511 / NBRC 101810 / Mat9-16) TaxID=945713 RepID=I0AN44_IGNAJ|nr:VOC family protein [Ignavibacterium album]AFH50401.1 Lactoylglutathione lyase-like protein [Ignavibacterium album JCM 16511]